MADDHGNPPAAWIADVLARWRPPDDFEAHMLGLVASYVSETAHPPGAAPDQPRADRQPE